MKDKPLVKRKCVPPKCISKEHGNYICEAIRLYGSTENQSISYMKDICGSFCFVVDSNGRTALHTAALIGKVKVLMFLIAHGANINQQDELLCCTPLHFAVRAANLDAALFLIKLGADTGIIDKDGFTASDYLAHPHVCLAADTEPILQTFSWGTNANYNLGLPHGHSRDVPEQFEVSKGDGFISSISMNKFHSMFLSNQGKVLSCGLGRGGRLGYEVDSPVIHPRIVNNINAPIVQVSCGVDHTVFLTRANKVLTCGINEYHQLGFHPPPPCLASPQILSGWHNKFGDVVVAGVVGAPFHTVIWSKSEIFCCGLNAGQLGIMYNQNEQYVNIPRRSDFLRKLDKSRVGEIMNVVASDGATVFFTQNGSIFALFGFEMHRIFSKAIGIKKISCIGGVVNTSLSITLPSHHKNIELKIAFLLTEGNLFIWSEKYSQQLTVTYGFWQLSHVSDYCLNTRCVCVVNNCQKVQFFFLNEDLLSEQSRMTKLNSIITPVFCKGSIYLRSFKKGPQMASLYRTHSIYCDPHGNNYIALQYDLRVFQRRKMGLTPNSLGKDIAFLFPRLSDLSVDFDIVVIVGDRHFPVHSYIICHQSELLCKMIHDLKKQKLKQKDKPSDVSSHKWTEKLEVVIGGVDANVFAELLQFMYTNECGKFNDPNRFIVMPYEENKETNGFVVLQECAKGNDIIEVLHLPRAKGSVASQKCLSANLKYPLKAIKEASCFFKMNSLIKKLLYLNNKDKCQFTLDGSISLLLDTPPPNYIYNRHRYSQLYDVTLQSKEGELFKCHKCILVARSSYFDALLSSRWIQHDKSDVVSISLSSIYLKPLLDFLYTNSSEIVSQSRDCDFLCDMLVIAHQYLLEDLNYLCQESLSKCLSLRIALNLLKFCEMFSAEKLRAVILEFISLNLLFFFDFRVINHHDNETLLTIGRGYRSLVSTQRDPKFWSPLVHENGDESPVNDFHPPSYAFSYTFKTKGAALMPTNIKDSSSLPTLEDLENVLKNYPSISCGTYEDWVENATAWPANCTSQTKERKIECGLVRKKKLRKRIPMQKSSSFQPPSSSHSESENTDKAGESSQQFSFDDLVDRLSSSAVTASDEDWKTVGKAKDERNRIKILTGKTSADDRSQENKNYEEISQRTRSDGERSPNVCLMKTSPHSFNDCKGEGKIEFPFLDDAPFPTLSEAVAMSASVRESMALKKRMPKFYIRNSQKLKNSQKSSYEEKIEPAKSPLSSPPSAWGWFPQGSEIAEDMIEDSSVLISTSPLKPLPSRREENERISSSSLDDNCEDLGDTYTPLRNNREDSLEEGYHWNPVTNCVIESPKDHFDSSFTSIMQEEVSYNKNLKFERNKPLPLIQIEEKAIKELLEFYGGEYNPEETVTVTRYQRTLGKPLWSVQYKNV